MKSYRKQLAAIGLLLLGSLAAGHFQAAETGLITVEAQNHPAGPWSGHATRTLASLPAFVPAETPSALSSYGGWRKYQTNATGFFHTALRGDRWWLVDPAGCLYLNLAVVAVAELRSDDARAAFQQKFGDESNWAQQTTELLRTNGFNGLGPWSSDEELLQASNHLAYTRIWNFMAGYGRKRGGIYAQPGHNGYPKDCIFVFDPEFETFCDDYARQLAAYQQDPWLIGSFSDNELPFKREALNNYLSLPPNEPGYQAAWNWLRQRHGAAAGIRDITAQDQSDFLAYVAERYFRIVSRAIRKYDPHHLYLGSRFHGGVLNCPEVFRAAGPYVDIVSVNLYNTWSPSPAKLAMWAAASGRPVLVSEWYVKGADSGLPNHSGAGWIVKSQADRGRFYQNFTLGLIESKVCIGWQWFRYADNDPTEPGVDQSNRDANKGIVSARYEPYAPLLAAMRDLNSQVYALAEYFDQSQPAAGTAHSRDMEQAKR